MLIYHSVKYCSLTKSLKFIGAKISLITVLRRCCLFPELMVHDKFVVIATASTCNVLLMRNSELNTGIEVVDEHGNVLGTSKAAARKVCTEICINSCQICYP